jgi:hypothetical protein
MVATGRTAAGPRYFDVAASLCPRSDGEPGFFGEVDDHDSPIAGVSAVGPDPDSTRRWLLRAAWNALRDPQIRWATGLDVDALAGLRLHLTTHHEIEAAELAAE